MWTNLPTLKTMEKAGNTPHLCILKECAKGPKGMNKCTDNLSCIWIWSKKKFRVKSRQVSKGSYICLPSKKKMKNLRRTSQKPHFSKYLGSADAIICEGSDRRLNYFLHVYVFNYQRRCKRPKGAQLTSQVYSFYWSRENLKGFPRSYSTIYVCWI